jgi:hypothetical protein
MDPVVASKKCFRKNTAEVLDNAEETHYLLTTLCPRAAPQVHGASPFIAGDDWGMGIY